MYLCLGLNHKNQLFCLLFITKKKNSNFFPSCWLDYETALLFAQLVPNTSMFIATIMMIEAAGSVDETNMTRLEGELFVCLSAVLFTFFMSAVCIHFQIDI